MTGTDAGRWRRRAEVCEFMDLAAGHPLFSAGKPLFFTRAPGRLDVMGGIADYSGSLVLELPLEAATLVAAQLADGMVFTAISTAAASFGGRERVEMPLERISCPAGPDSYGRAHDLLTADPASRWAAYVAGVMVALQVERGVEFSSGIRLLIHSHIPAGSGIASSAALEVAVMRAVCAVYGLDVDEREQARLCQKVENFVVGAPCGIMDQMTASCGRENRLLQLLCQPDTLLGTCRLPPEVEFWGIDSGIRHQVSGADYGSVRAGAFIGYRMIAELDGLHVEGAGNGRAVIHDPVRRGYLANITVEEWQAHYRDRIPETIGGAEFLRRYGGISDRAVRIDPDRIYPVRAPTAHPIEENRRVKAFIGLLRRRRLDDEDLRALGELMTAAHDSYGACGLGSAGTDILVQMVKQDGPAKGLFGAKITGGGSGGTAAVLGRRGCLPAVKEIAAEYGRKSDQEARVFGGSSPGASRFGVVQRKRPKHAVH